jgi:DNA-binding SARP family transcriptional activator
MGPLRVWRDDIEVDAGPRQQRCLLALLLVRAGRTVGVSELIDLLWGTDPPASAVNVIHKYVGTLRRVLEPGLPRRSAGSYLLRHRTGYRFAAGPETLDLVQFRQLAAAARARVAEGLPEDAVDRYVEALRLCHGTTGEALADNPGAAAVFAGIDSEFFDAAVAATEVAVRVGRAMDLLRPLRLAAEMGRLNEPIHAGLMTTLAAAGYQAESLLAYGTIRDRLAEELGIDPGNELRKAQQRVLAPAAAMSRPSPLIRPAQLPPDQPLFTGRRAELDLLHELVAERYGGSTGPAVIAVDGVAGVGKSAIVTRFAHTIAGRFADGQLYLDLRGDEGHALRSLLHALGVRAPDFPDTFDALVGTYRSLTAAMRVLVVLDNARDAEQVRPLVPSSSGSLVLVTSRDPLLGLASSGDARLHRIGLPGLPEARELFRARLVPERRAADQRILDEIVELCGRLPMALAVQAARLNAWPQLSLESVVAELRDDWDTEKLLDLPR